MPGQNILFHGSNEYLEVLRPDPRGYSGQVNSSVYATSHHAIAVAFALTYVAFKEDEGCQWDVSLGKYDEPRISVWGGDIDLYTNGYVYTVSADKFLKINELEWMSQQDVLPIHIERIDPRNYYDWVSAFA